MAGLPYFIALLYVIILLWYSFVLHAGTKEQHTEHLIYAGLGFPFIAFVFSRYNFISDLLFFLPVAGGIVLSGYLYWEYQDSISESEFSFENGYMGIYVINFAVAAFVLSEILKWLTSQIIKKINS